MRHLLIRLLYGVFAISVTGTLAYGDSSKAEFPEAVFLIGYPDGQTEGFGLSEASYHSYSQTYRKPIVHSHSSVNRDKSTRLTILSAFKS